MGIFARLLKTGASYRRRQAEREALRLLVARGDARMLRDVGLTLIEGSNRGYDRLPQIKERRWTAPLIYLPPSALSSSTNKRVVAGKTLGTYPSPHLQGEGDRQAG